MNVFVLCTGRCGSMTFARACGHFDNYTSAHESRCGRLGPERLAYPARHIEVDNRLSWLLGRLDAAFGDEAAYVHLVRDPAAVAASFVERVDRGIMRAYRHDGILLGLAPDADPLDVAADYVATVNANVALFLRNKSRRMTFRLEQAESDFPVFCQMIGATGDLAAARATFGTHHNASPSRAGPTAPSRAA